MSKATKRFPKNELLDMGLPHDAPEGGEIISDKVTGKSRWSVHHEVIFRLPDQPAGIAWAATYSVGATESQNESAWEHVSEVECTLVHQVERLVKVWEPAEVPDAG